MSYTIYAKGITSNFFDKDGYKIGNCQILCVNRSFPWIDFLIYLLIKVRFQGILNLAKAFVDSIEISIIVAQCLDAYKHVQ